MFIGGNTAIIGDVAGHLGCFINLKDGVNAIAFVALGTSVPGRWCMLFRTEHVTAGFVTACPVSLKVRVTFWRSTCQD